MKLDGLVVQRRFGKNRLALSLAACLALGACGSQADLSEAAAIVPTSTASSVVPSQAPKRSQPEETEATQAEATETEATQAEATEPEVTQAEATQPQATQPQATQPEPTVAPETQPGPTESQSGFGTNDRLAGFRWPAEGTMGLGYEYIVHPVYETKRLHAGQDIRGPAGTPIVAAKAGMVEFAGERGGYGNAVVIDHGDGVKTLYAHQSVIVVGVGDTIDAGQQLGEIGSSGTATGTVLFFQVQVDEGTIDPLTVLPARS